MDRIEISPSLSMSRLIYGMWRVKDDADTSLGHVRAKIDACLEQGITTIDQADIYGDYGAEAVFGQALKDDKSLRDQIEIVTKCDIVAPIGMHSDKRVKYYDTSGDYITQAVERSLTEMGIENIDVLLVHRPDPFMDHQDTGAALDALVSSGKVSNIGVSNFKLHDWTLLQSAMSNQLVTNQIELSVLANEAFSNGDVAYLQERSIAPMAWSPLAGGSLFDDKHSELLALLTEIGARHGVDGAAVAVAWLLAHPANIMPVLGTNNLDRIKSISDALKVDIDRITWFEIYERANGSEVP